MAARCTDGARYPHRTQMADKSIGAAPEVGACGAVDNALTKDVRRTVCSSPPSTHDSPAAGPGTVVTAARWAWTLPSRLWSAPLSVLKSLLLAPFHLAVTLLRAAWRMLTSPLRLAWSAAMAVFELARFGCLVGALYGGLVMLSRLSPLSVMMSDDGGWPDPGTGAWWLVLMLFLGLLWMARSSDRGPVRETSPLR